MLHSIRWRLQLWYGLILVIVLAGFGVTAYQLERGKQFRRIDEELQRRLGALVGAFRPGPQPRLRPPGPRPGLRLPERPLPAEPERGDGRFAGPLPEGLPAAPGEFHLPRPPAALFDESDTNGYYYVLWLRDGRELARSTNAPAVEPISLRGDGPEPHPPRMRGVFRELFRAGPPGEIMLVGRSIAPELGELRRAAWRLSVVGIVVLLVGLVGGWWIATRAIRPIADISGTAAQIAAGDLSQRINIAVTDNELGRLAVVLNSTFARLEAAFAQQRQFTSDAAHELRTPVSVMLTQTQTALTRERSGAEYRNTIEACQRAGQRMRRLIESLLELARLDAGQEPLQRVAFEFTGLVRDCVEAVRPLAEERGVRVLAELPPLPGTGDPERLKQVITNLLTNAIRYSPQGSEVKLAGRVDGKTIVFSVTDSGPGILPEDLPHLFKRFYRADKSRSSEGTGLGLAISRAIVEAHGGSLEVDSQPGRGATFTLRLPI